MKRTAPLIAMLALAACTSSDSPDESLRYQDPKQTYTVVRPEAWGPALVRGLTQLTRTDAGHARHTIVIRSAERPPSILDGKATTRDDIIASTTKALRSLPRATVTATAAISETELPATRFSLTFQPTGLASRYRREHAVLVGSKHLYHVIYTAPIGEPIDERAFATMVSTLTEGV